MPNFLPRLKEKGTQNPLERNIWKYYAFSFLMSFSFIGGVLIPFFTDWGGINQFQIQILQAWFMLWIFILEVPTGVVADYLGRKYSLAIGAFISVLGAIIYGFIPHFWAFLLGEFLWATAIAFQSGADEALIYDSLKSQGKENLAKKILGKTRSFELVAIGLGAPIGGLLASRLGLNFPMLVTSLPCLCGTLIALTFKEPKPSGISESKRYLEILKGGIAYFKNHSILKSLAADTIIVASSAYFVVWLYQRVLQKIGIPIIWFGFFALFLTLTQIIITNNFHKLERFFGSIRKYLKITALLVGIGLILTGISQNIITVLLLLILAGGFGLTRITHISAHINALIPSEKRATVLSAISMFRRFSLVLLNPIVGFFVDKSLGYTLIGLGTIPILVFLFSPLKDSMFSEPEKG